MGYWKDREDGIREGGDESEREMQEMLLLNLNLQTSLNLIAN